MPDSYGQHETPAETDLPHVQTKREIRLALDAAGMRPRKQLGQHFLIDGNLMRRLVASAELDKLDCVLEVGAGTGGLTDLLATRVRKAICVELDRDLHQVLEDRFRGVESVQLIQGDVLSSKHRLMPEVVEAVDQYDGGESGRVKLVANLPYRVATPVLMNLLLNHTVVRRLCFTVQAEVGERLVAQPGTKAYGPLSIITQMLCSIDTITRIRPEAFWPRPAIDSVMMRMNVNDTHALKPGDVQSFAELVRKTFDHRRKTIRSALGYVVSDPQRDKVCQEFDPVRRPESFEIEEWLEIYRIANSD